VNAYERDAGFFSQSPFYARESRPIEDIDVGVASVAGGGSDEVVEVGKVYVGRVSSVKEFGAFVEILPGRDGLCHISELSAQYTSNAHDICRVGDEVQVKVLSVDELGRIKLSRRQAMTEAEKASVLGMPKEATPAPAQAQANAH
jgi:predicted RNA-binding protein with RPS1 domain